MRGNVWGRDVKVVGHDFLGGFEVIMALEVTGTACKRILSAFRIGQHLLCTRELFGKVECAHLNSSEVYIVDSIDRIHGISSNRLRSVTGLSLNPGYGIFEAFLDHDLKSSQSQGTIAIEYFSLDLVGAVSDTRKIGFHQEWGLAKIAVYFVELAQVFHNICRHRRGANAGEARLRSRRLA